MPPTLREAVIDGPGALHVCVTGRDGDNVALIARDVGEVSAEEIADDVLQGRAEDELDDLRGFPDGDVKVGDRDVLAEDLASGLLVVAVVGGLVDEARGGVELVGGDEITQDHVPVGHEGALLLVGECEGVHSDAETR